ncbi:MAG: hypothetical protein ACFFD6_11635 [Candidatus Thorarchaeota archaeon]
MIQGERHRVSSKVVVDLVDLVEQNWSSVDMMSERLGLTPEDTQRMLLDLVEEGRISGRLTPDGERFFRTDAKVSDAPVISSTQELNVHQSDARPGILIMLAGIALYIIGNILVNVNPEFEFLWNLGSSLVFLGPLVLIGGLFYISKVNPTQKLR